MNVLICPDKFKGTLTSEEAAESIRRGWKRIRPRDRLTVQPFSDGGDGFGAIIARILGARKRRLRTVNAAGDPVTAHWWWHPAQRLAVIETARFNGLAMLPPGRHHPFDLDTRGIAPALQAAASLGARSALIGIGGSATNDAGFGLARGLGWKFLDRSGGEILHWPELTGLKKVVPPRKRKIIPSITVAVDVQNPLLGKKGCSRVYGPQKGLRAEDMKPAEAALRRLATVLKGQLGFGEAAMPGAGAAGGLGFGLNAFTGARLRSGFDLVAQHAGLGSRVRQSDLVITGEGALDRQTLMGKGVGEIGQLCRRHRVPCLGLAGHVENPEKAGGLFAWTGSLTEQTSRKEAMQRSGFWLEQLAALAAAEWSEQA